MQSDELRRAFLQFFAQREHRLVPSASLVPGNDPSLLFTNAGMVPFKEVFLGREKPPAANAVSAQKCLRAGGKHNDLDNVGYTARHHTFFEMLGNFSFGGYFKQQAIAYAWEFLTQVVKLDAKRLWVSVHHSDEESAAIWRDVAAVPAERLMVLGDDDNFWSMAETGPCGPCSEIYFDQGDAVAGGPPGSGDEGDRWLEIWNLVFMQYDRRTNGEMVALPKPCVDTGMGLERLTAAVQGQHTNYGTDLFAPLVEHCAQLLGCNMAPDEPDAASLRVIADHVRALCFLVADGISPDNEGRGYVLRRILRRAARHGHRLGATEPFLHRLVPFLAGRMGTAYPQLKQSQDSIVGTIRNEEEQFGLTLERGMRMLWDRLASHPGEALPGEMVFLLHDTYGFPVDMTADFAREQGLQWDKDGYEREMLRQREMSRSADSFRSEHTDGVADLAATEFSGYERLEDEGTVLALWRGDEPVPVLTAGEEGRLALDRSPFYAQAGGQIGDSGAIRADGVVCQVHDCLPEGGVHLHSVVVSEGQLQPGDKVHLAVDAERRAAIMRNHSATHLLHAALCQLLGDGVQQRGSWVGAERLRFDFSHPSKLNGEQQRQVEEIVCEQVLANTPVSTRIMDQKAALEAGAVALFGEKYGERVRVLNMGGEFSVEFCGGTHVARTGDIGLFRILSESSVSAGVRRIEAVTGRDALRWYRERVAVLGEVAAQLKCGMEEITERLTARLQKPQGEGRGEGTASHGVCVAVGKASLHLVLTGEVENIKQLRGLRPSIDALAGQLPATNNGAEADIRVLAAPLANGQIAVLATVCEQWQGKAGADAIVRYLAEQTGGKGGGKPDFAQAGGGDATTLPQALEQLIIWLSERLQ